MRMPKPIFASRLPLRDWIRKLVNSEGSCKRPKRETRNRRLVLECLEDRLAPAIVSEAAGVLTFNLDGGAGNEVLTFVTTTANSYTVTSSTGLSVVGVTPHWDGVSLITPINAGLVQIRVIDTAQTASATNTETVVFGTNTGGGYFANSGAGSFVIDLTRDVAGSDSVSFAGNNINFSPVLGTNLTVTVAKGNINSANLSSLSVNSALSLTATAGNINIAGSIIHGNIALGFPEVVMSAGGAGGIAETNTGVLNINYVPVTSTFRATGSGNIDLSLGTNTFANTVNLSTSAPTSTISLTTSTTTQLGNVSVGADGASTGLLTIDSNGTIIQNAGIIQSDGAALFTMRSAGGSIFLNEANDIAGVVTLAGGAPGDVFDLALHNINPNANFALTNIDLTNGDINNLTIIQDNSPLAASNPLNTGTVATPVLPAINVAGSLNLQVAGPINEGANAITVPGNANFTVFGNFGISLGTSTNAIGGTITLSNPDADATAASAVSFVNTGDVLLGDCDPGHSTFDITSTGDISQTGAITQRPGAGSATFTAGGTSIDLSDGDNRFTGVVNFAGATVTSISFSNSDPLATFPTLPTNYDDSLTIDFGNAPVVLPGLNLTNATNGSLDVSAQGIFQAGALVVANAAIFNGNAFPIILNNSGNDFGQGGAAGDGIRLANSGPNEVVVVDMNALNFIGASNVGYGSLTVIAGGSGSITEDLGASISQQFTNALIAGAVTLSSGGDIILDQGNNLIGELRLDPGPTGNVNISNSVDIILGGQLATGATNIPGSLTLDANGNDIFQRPGTVLTIAGATTVQNATSLVLNNIGNSFGGDVTLTGVGSATLRDISSGIQFAASTVGELTVVAGGDITQSGVITDILGAPADLDLDASAAAIILTTAGNNFGSITLASTTGDISIVDQDDITINEIELGSGTLSITAGNDIDQTIDGFLRQTGTGNITLNPGAGNALSLASNNNSFLGTIDFGGAAVGDMSLRNQQGITLAATAAFTGTGSLNAEGVTTLPTGALTVDSLLVVAREIVVANDISVDGLFGQIVFIGNTRFTDATPTLTTTGVGALGNVFFAGDVIKANPADPVVINLFAGATLAFSKGVWDQGTGNLTINGGSVTFQIQGAGEEAAFRMAGGATLNMPGFGTINLSNDARIEVGSAATAEIATINTAGGDIMFGANSALVVGLDATLNDKLVVQGGGDVILNVASRLLGNDGLAGAASNVLEVTGGGIIDGFFANTVHDDNTPASFLMGTDIADATYSATVISVAQGGTAELDGTFFIFQEDGDKVTVTVTVTAPAASGLAFDVNSSGNLILVLRNANAAANTLTIATTKGAGDGIADMGGIAVNGTGAVTINAASADFFGDITVQGRLTALNVRDVHDHDISAGGFNNQTTTITGRLFETVDIDLLTVLSALNVKQYEEGRIVAERFGTITSAGLASAGLPGDFAADLINLDTANSPAALTSATIAGQASGTWDLDGSVGTVKAHSADNLDLGTRDGAGAVNGNQVTSIASVSLGVANNVNVRATGRITTITAKSWDIGEILAGSIGSITTTGDATIGDTGGFNNIDVIVSGNAGGTTRLALGSLNAKGEIGDSSFTFRDGNVTTIAAGRTLANSNMFARTSATSGAIGSIKAAAYLFASLEAKSVGALNVTGNASAGLVGDMDTVDILLHGTAGSNANTLGTLLISRAMPDCSLTIENGSVGSVTVKNGIFGSPISVGTTIGGTAGGVIGLFSAGAIDDGDVLARSIGTYKVTGVAATLPDNQLLRGNVEGSFIDTYLNSGTGKAIGTLSIAGDLHFFNTGEFIRADNGIGSFTVKGEIDANGSALISVNNSGAVTSTVGRIGSLTAGAMFAIDIMANSIGTVKITGYTDPDENPSLINGDIAGGNWTVRGGFQSSTAPLTGVGTILATGEVLSLHLVAPFGLKSLTLNGSVATDSSSGSGALDGGSSIVTQNPLTPTSGKIGSISAKRIDDVTIRANAIGSITTTKGPLALQLSDAEQDGHIFSSTIVATATSGTAITTISASRMTATEIRTIANIGTIKVAEQMSFVDIGVGQDLDTTITLGKINSLSAGSIDNLNLSTRTVGTISVLGNATIDLVGDVNDSLFTIAGTGTPTNVALTTFTAKGSVVNSTFNIARGNVTSFTAAKFLASDLLVGFHMPKAVDILTATTAANWIGDFRISSVKTTQPFSTTNVAATAAFVDSNVVASRLGTITITGINPLTNDVFPIAYGVAFRDAATGGSAGAVVVADSTTGVSTARSPGYSDGKFNRNQLSGT